MNRRSFVGIVTAICSSLGLIWSFISGVRARPELSIALCSKDLKAPHRIITKCPRWDDATRVQWSGWPRRTEPPKQKHKVVADDEAVDALIPSQPFIVAVVRGNKDALAEFVNDGIPEDSDVKKSLLKFAADRGYVVAVVSNGFEYCDAYCKAIQATKQRKSRVKVTGLGATAFAALCPTGTPALT